MAANRTQRGPGQMDPQLNFDPQDPIQVAVKITQMEAAHLASQDRFNVTAANLNEGISGLRQEVRAMVDQLRDLSKLGHAQEGHSQGLARAFEAIEKLAKQTEQGFSERDDGLETWKEKHVAENQQTRERLILWNGVATGVSLLATALVAIMVYVYTGDKAVAAANVARVEREAKEAAQKAQATADANAAAYREVERYLTQEGTIAGRPYVPNRR